MPVTAGQHCQPGGIAEFYFLQRNNYQEMFGVEQLLLLLNYGIVSGHNEYNNVHLC